MTEKEEITRKYLHYIHNLRSIKDSLAGLQGGRNSQFTEIQNDFIQALEEELHYSTAEMEHAINGTVWDKLTIAFFGETNAGKSTIIETFRILFDKQRNRNNDGTIVGDGRSDYTQTYEEYNLEIENQPFTLIDVPGIEGNEKVYAEDIKRALRRAHIVFYVHGHNTKPNKATAEKIKEYLGDWVNVYTIYNVRGSVSDYDEEEERNTLYTDKVIEGEKLIVSTFEEVLGKVYKGNISIQALLAMCSFAEFAPEREDLISKQAKLLRFFGTRQALLDFSRFNLAQELVLSKSCNYKEEIVKSNEQKMYSMARRAYMHLQYIVDSRQERIESFKRHLSDFKRDVHEAFSTTQRNIATEMRSEVEVRMSSLSVKVDKIIDDRFHQKIPRTEYAVKNEMDELSANIGNIVDSEIESLLNKIEKKKHFLDAEYCNSITVANSDEKISSDIRFRSAIAKMNISFGDYLEFAGTVISGAFVGSWFTFVAPGLATAMGAIAGGIIHCLRKLVFGDNGKSKAKEETRRSIRAAKNEINEMLEKRLHEIETTLQSKQHEVNMIIDKELDSLERMNDTIAVTKRRIKEFAIQLKQ